jgi:uncharacterized protein with von Willebrand factor type A (vWA) domain
VLEEESMPSVIEGVRQNSSYWYRAGRVADLLEKLGKKPESFPLELAGDVYYMFYLPFPKIVSNPNSSKDETMRAVLLSMTLQEAKTWKIKALTVADPAISTVAATIFSSAIISMINSGSGGTKGREQRNERGSGGGLSRATIRKALKETSEAVQNAAALKSIIARTGAGNTSNLSFEDSLDIMLELAKKTDIREIARILTKIEISKLPTAKSSRSPRGWISSLEIGSDIERVHPSRLAFPEELFLVELANSRLLLYRKELSSEDGPIYVLLDKSGSMSGEKINWARAVALALLTKARASGRRFYVRVFDSITYELKVVERVSRPRKVMSIVKYLATVKASGGTNITNAIAKAVEDIESSRAKGSSDIVLITDGEDKLSSHILRSILPQTIRLHTVMIKGDNRTLQEVSSSYLSAMKLDEREALKVVKLAFT